MVVQESLLQELAQGDHICSVNGRSTADLSALEVYQLLSGSEGTVVHITGRRFVPSGDGETGTDLRLGLERRNFCACEPESSRVVQLIVNLITDLHSSANKKECMQQSALEICRNSGAFADWESLLRACHREAVQLAKETLHAQYAVEAAQNECTKWCEISVQTENVAHELAKSNSALDLECTDLRLKVEQLAEELYCSKHKQ